MEAAYTRRKTIRRGDHEHFVEITVRARPSVGLSEVVLSPEVLDRLREAFGPDFEHARHCVRAAVAVQIDTANAAGEMPHVGAASFHAEVIGVRVSRNAGREISGYLLSVAGMDAIADFLEDWENAQSGAGGSV